VRNVLQHHRLADLGGDERPALTLADRRDVDDGR
jgi:hypothetical protein